MAVSVLWALRSPGCIYAIHPFGGGPQ
uniref:Uncharacterized protein n=1 Tax=Anguilla anguilla TaxID=7936 RepID=A0A0E9XJM0_ANGAN